MAQQPPNNAQGPAPTNYRELYSTLDYQAGEPIPGRLVASYRFTEVPGAGLNDRHSISFLCLARKVDVSVEFRILHHMMQFFELPGDGGMDIADLSMGLLGNIRAAQMPVVEVDKTHFSLIGAGVQVCTAAVMPDHLRAVGAERYLGPYYAADTPNTELIRPRYTQVLPPRYAATLVHRVGVTPATAYHELNGMLEANGALEACADIVAWLRVACTAGNHRSTGAPEDSSASTSRVWKRFCTAKGISPDLHDLPGHCPLLLLFAHQYCTGPIATGDRPVRSCTVEDDAIRHGAHQVFTQLGAADHRLNAFSDLDFRLHAILQAWKREDPPPTRVNSHLLANVCQAHHLAFGPPPGSLLSAASNCLMLAFYFHLHPGNYSGTLHTTANDDLFRYQDVGVWIGHRHLDPARCTATSTSKLSLSWPVSPPSCFEAATSASTSHPSLPRPPSGCLGPLPFLTLTWPQSWLEEVHQQHMHQAGAPP